MALCILGKREVFCGETNTSDLTEEQADRIIEIVYEMLYEYNPEIVWLPNTCEIGVERTDLYLARQEFDINEIAIEMEQIWERAYEQLLKEE